MELLCSTYLQKCLQNSIDIEEGTLGLENEDIRIDEMLKVDLLDYLVFLSYSDGDLHKKELHFINDLLNYNFTKDTMFEYATNHVLPSQSFLNHTPRSFQYFIRAEYELNKTYITTYKGIVQNYILTFQKLGQELIASNKIVTQPELDALASYGKMLTDIVSAKKEEDPYYTFGRQQVAINSKTVLDSKDLDKSNLLNQVTSNASDNSMAQTNFSNSITPPESEKTTDELLEELNNMIGLGAVKKEVNNLINKIHISKLRTEQGLSPLPMEMHLVFTGNPGTGKTTVARLIAKIYYSLGILSKGQFVEVDRSGLVAGYMGQTAEKVQEVVKRSLGGVLFIDEAYSLVVDKSEGDFGKEAIDTLNKCIEDHREDFIVIVAGYPKEMDLFLDANPGMKSRFNTYVHFEDYGSTDLVKILIYMSKKMEYFFEPEAITYIIDVLDKAVLTKSKNFGNARDVRNYLDRITTNQINRLVESNETSKVALSAIKLEDVENVSFSQQ